MTNQQPVAISAAIGGVLTTGVYPSRAIDITGQRFGRLTVIARAGTEGRSATWRCRCDCGKESPRVRGNFLRHGRVRSCGCLQIERVRETVHGHAGHARQSRTYASWAAMKQRCSNPGSTAYDRYGGRGIQYDPRWETFAGFLADMGDRPAGTWLERIANDGNYGPDNCRWATPLEQAQNRSPRRNQACTR